MFRSIHTSGHFAWRDESKSIPSGIGRLSTAQRFNAISYLRHANAILSMKESNADLCYNSSMQSRELKTLLSRVATWPKGAQEEATKALREIEEDFIIGPATTHELDVARQEALRGEGTEMEELLSRYNL